MCCNIRFSGDWILQFREVIMETKDIQEIVTNISKALTGFSAEVLKCVKSIDVTPLLNSIKEIVDSIPQISVSEKQKGALVDRYVSYAKYGWSIHPEMPALIKRNAKSLEQSDKYMAKHCTRKKMSALFEKIRKNSKIDEADIDEAILCYKSKMYKASLMICFSIIDGLLIRLQKKSNQYRSVNTAREKLNTITKDQTKYLFLLLNTQNTLECIKTIYQSPKDFSIQFDCINRDTLVHGMMSRDATKTDCDKIFILLYNLLSLLQFYRIDNLG